MGEKVVIVGASGFGRETADVVEAMGVPIIGILDDNPSEINLGRLESRGLAYLGGVDAWLEQQTESVSYSIGIGSGRVRELIADKFDRAGHQAFTAIHPSVTLGANCDIGPGAVICAGVRLTTNITLGRHVQINPNVTVGHDVRLDDFVSVNPTVNVSGEVSIGARTLLGVGATVLQGLTVGADAVVGGCSLVTKDVPDGVTVKGIPGRW
ncbi:MAG TPA: acetyltransferase [Propionibacterium sp.]|nr:acetyltransferase [Propionibacterium sp.]